MGRRIWERGRHICVGDTRQIRCLEDLHLTTLMERERGRVGGRRRRNERVRGRGGMEKEE